jgi:hypothetical protein
MPEAQAIALEIFFGLRSDRFDSDNLDFGF